MDRLKDAGPLGCVSTTAGMALVMSLADTAPRLARSSPVTADSAMPTSCEFCARFCAVTMISSSPTVLVVAAGDCWASAKRQDPNVSTARASTDDTDGTRRDTGRRLEAFIVFSPEVMPRRYHNFNATRLHFA